MSDAIIGGIRTLVPLIVGAVIAFLVSNGVIDEETAESTTLQLVTLMTAVFSFLYWGAVRLLAAKWPKLGVLLGYNVAPKYNDESAATAYNAMGNE